MLPLLWKGVVCLAALASAFHPYHRPAMDPKGWAPVKVSNNAEDKRDIVQFPTVKLKRGSRASTRGLHPEVRHIIEANHITRKFRRRGIEVPEDVDEDRALVEKHESLKKRGLAVRQNSGTSNPTGVADIVIPPGTNFPQPTYTGVVPAETPITPDSSGIAQDGNDFSYFSFIAFGSNHKDFKLVVDTGSSDTWIPSSECRSRACAVQTTFGPRDSKTLRESTRAFDIKYGSGDVMGLVVQDTMAFAGFNFTTQFGLATQVSDDFVNFEIDGILGLGFTAASDQQVPTVMDRLQLNGYISAKLFGIALSRAKDGLHDGVINFGGIDRSLFEGDLTFTNIVDSEGLWEIPFDGASVDGNATNISGRTAVIDTGTSLALIPPQDALQLHLQIPGAQSNGETFAIPCTTTSKIEIAFSGVPYTIQPEDYVGMPLDNRGMCESLIGGRAILPGNTWLLGDVFLKNVYSVFDLDNGRIGFATKKRIGRGVQVTATPTKTPSATASSDTSAAVRVRGAASVGGWLLTATTACAVVGFAGVLMV